MVYMGLPINVCSSNTFSFLLLEFLTAAFAVLDITAQTESLFKLTTILSFWIGLCYLFFYFIYYCVFICVCAWYMWVHMLWPSSGCQDKFVESVLSFHPPFSGFQGSNSGGQACTASVFTGEPPHQLSGGFCVCVCVCFNESKRHFEERVCDFLWYWPHSWEVFLI